MEVLVLAAGKGKRFKAGYEKIQAPFFGKTVLEGLLYTVKAFFKGNVEKVSVLFSNETKFVLQDDYNEYIQCSGGYGTAWGVKSFLKQKEINDDLLVLFADSPLISKDSIAKFHEKKADLVIGVMEMPSGDEAYGRVLFEGGKVVGITEFVNHPEKTQFANSGILKISKKAQALISKIKENINGEFFLTDLVSICNESGLSIDFIVIEPSQALGFNSVQEYSNLLKQAQVLWRRKAENDGVVFYDADSVFLSQEFKADAGVIIEPNVHFLGKVELKSGAHIRSFSVLQDCVISGTVGPFAYLRDEVEIGENSHIGAFVEVKKSKIGKGVKAKHLAYIGNANLADNVNIGAGAVFCNYDGKKKSSIEIGESSFIGANSSLVAPLKTGSNVYLAAGSVLSENLRSNSFAIARSLLKTKVKSSPEEKT